MYLILVIFVFVTRVSSQINGFHRNCLSSHNKYRAKHGSPPLVWSDSLAAEAQKWAETLAKENQFKHDKNSINTEQIGENLAYFTPSRPECMGEKRSDCVACEEMVADWYNEVKDYDFQTGEKKTPKAVVSHFTQVVWKGTKQLGVGTAKASDSTYGFITVARYSPRGNMGSPAEFKRNVLPLATPGTSTNSAPSTASPPPTRGSTTTPNIPTENPTTKKPGEDCEFFIITTVTKEKKIIQKCKGKPNTTFIVQHSKSVSTSKPLGVSTGPPTTSSSLVTTQVATTPKSGPVTTPAAPSQPESSTPGSPGHSPTPGNPSQRTSSPTSTSTINPGVSIPTKGLNHTQQEKALMLINVYRTMHSAHPLMHSDQLTEQAQKWAEHLAENGQLVHDPSTTDGENIAAIKGDAKDIENVIETWYDEENQYDYTAPGFSKSTGHFTQLVWKSSKEFGVGIAPSKDKSRYYIVARFRPSGNIQNKFADNIGPKAVR